MDLKAGIDGAVGEGGCVVELIAYEGRCTVGFGPVGGFCTMEEEVEVVVEIVVLLLFELLELLLLLELSG